MTSHDPSDIWDDTPGVHQGPGFRSVTMKIMKAKGLLQDPMADGQHEMAECVTHKKKRSTKNLVRGGDGRWRCKDNNPCRFGEGRGGFEESETAKVEKMKAEIKGGSAEDFWKWGSAGMLRGAQGTATHEALEDRKRKQEEEAEERERKRRMGLSKRSLEGGPSHAIVPVWERKRLPTKALFSGGAGPTSGKTKKKARPFADAPAPAGHKAPKPQKKYKPKTAGPWDSESDSAAEA
eukprot:TRINITY_DN19182_c0_g1_i1.p1 TRINITY_DN19182_c0_g1~~TRINITY_DN19182_c0_g1_i1.p1  ORF type:complete len:236 (+),score=68.73 TRINITY_DN19182_c0_g1_i1:114-821(+)